ncbi:reverse transcriptase domain-containing protein [Silvimonas sp.]|uniref:reverse transcriptase domain-containing protein n=1 Tax=Silvimonas sp. TaxID=2650811 RepID=UPI0028474083|nr:reverse transcriptase domain-containing protein [Silvimonas sp.]MDR3427814.1 DDE-type integrase/transposase/recombinase [Silvimonas sp.]
MASMQAQMASMMQERARAEQLQLVQSAADPASATRSVKGVGAGQPRTYPVQDIPWPKLRSTKEVDARSFLEEYAEYCAMMLARGLQPVSLLMTLTREQRRGMGELMRKYARDEPALDDLPEGDEINGIDATLWEVRARATLEDIAKRRPPNGSDLVNLEARIREKIYWDSNLASFDDSHNAFLLGWGNLVAEYGYADMLAEGGTPAKTAIRCLIDRLHPPEFRDIVRRDVAKESIKTLDDFFNLLDTYASGYNFLKRCRDYHSSGAESGKVKGVYKNKGSEGGKPSGKPTEGSVGEAAPAPVKSTVTSKPSSSPLSSSKAPAGKESAGDSGTVKALKCHECKKDHKVRDCPTASEERKLYWKEQYTRDKKSTSRVKAATATMHRDGRISFGGTSLCVPFTVDTGASETFVPERIAEQLREAGFRAEDLPHPLIIITAKGGPDGIITATQQIVGDAVLHFTGGGVSHVRDMRLLIVPKLADGEILLGRRFIEDHAKVDLVDVFRKACATLPPDDITLSDVKEALAESEETKECDTPRLKPAHVASLKRAAIAMQLQGEEEELQLPPSIGVTDLSEIRAELHKAVLAADGFNLLSKEAVAELTAIVEVDFIDSFRVVLGNDPPADVEPIRVQMKPGLGTIRHKPRKYSPEASEFLRLYIKMLVDFGYIYFDRDAICASPVHPVRKPHASLSDDILNQFRLAVDMREVNQYAYEGAFPLPHPDSFAPLLAGQRYFGKLDLLGGYWQMPLHEDSQKYFSIQTDAGVWTSRRLIQGFRNATGPFQAIMVGVLGDLVNTACFVFLDDILVFGKTEREFVDNWRKVLTALTKARLKIAARKTVLFEPKIKFCGKIYSAKGVHSDTAYVESLVKMGEPTDGAQLRKYIACTNWLRDAIHDYARLVAPLQELLKAVGRAAPNPKQRGYQSVSLAAVGWNETHSRAFNELNRVLARETERAYPDDTQALCVFTDASDLHWAGVITQVPPEQLALPLDQQHHSPLAFVSGSFDATQRRWPTVEQEGYAIKETCVRCRHLLQRRDGFRIYTDHLNLRYIFNSDVALADGRKQAADRIERWKIIMGAFKYSIHHIDGERNIFPDMLSRWGNPAAGAAATDSDSTAGVDEALTLRCATRLKAAAGLPLPAGDPDGPPSEALLRAVQRDGITAADREVYKLREDPRGLWVNEAGLVFVPDIGNIRAQLVAVAHQGVAGHRGSDTTTAWLREVFFWPGLVSQVHQACRDCVICLKTRGGATVPREKLVVTRATRPNERLHFDFCYIREVTADTPGQVAHVLVIVDDFSRFVELVPAKSADSATVAGALLAWFARYGVCTQWTSDRGPHFTSQIMATLADKLKARHHFTAPYAPWSNGLVERANKELKQLLSAFLLQHGMAPHQWPDALPVIQAAMNNTPSARLGGYTPLQAFMGHTPLNPLQVVLNTHTSELVDAAVVSDDIKTRIASINEQFQKMVHDVAAVAPRADKRPGASVNFAVGDLVLTATPGVTIKDKTQASWEGPAQVIEQVNSRVFVVQDVTSGRRQTLHADFLKSVPESDSTTPVTPTLQQLAADSGRGFAISDIKGNRELTSGEWQLRILWEADKSMTWEPLTTIFEAEPRLVRSYVSKLRNQHTKDVLQAVLRSLTGTKRRTPRSKRRG